MRSTAGNRLGSVTASPRAPSPSPTAQEKCPGVSDQLRSARVSAQYGAPRVLPTIRQHTIPQTNPNHQHTCTHTQKQNTAYIHNPAQAQAPAHTRQHIYPTHPKPYLEIPARRGKGMRGHSSTDTYVDPHRQNHSWIYGRWRPFPIIHECHTYTATMVAVTPNLCSTP